MLGELHFKPGFGEEAVIFGSTFFDARFAAVWAKWHGIRSDGGKHLGQEGILLARSRTGGVDG